MIVIPVVAMLSDSMGHFFFFANFGVLKYFCSPETKFGQKFLAHPR